MADKSASGFTLLEMVIAITTLSLLAMMVTPFLSLSVRAYNRNAAELSILADLRYASERVAREIREIRRNPVAPANYDIVTPLAPANLTFVRNNGETVTIEGVAPQLNLRYQSLAANAPFPLSTSLQNITFNYFRSDEITPASGPNDVAYIEFEIQLVANARVYRQRSRIALRAQP